MADNESSVEEKAQTIYIVAEANKTNKKKKRRNLLTSVFSLFQDQQQELLSFQHNLRLEGQFQFKIILIS